MKIHYIFSRNKKVGSKVIAWASGLLLKDLEKTPSHGAILIEFSTSESIVFESTLESGVRLVPYSKWLNINELCYKITPKKQPSESEIFQEINNLWGKSYDFKGILYFAYCFVKVLYFKSKFPNKNKWESGDKFYCLEAMFNLTNYDKSGMVTPAKMCLDLMKRENNG